MYQAIYDCDQEHVELNDYMVIAQDQDYISVCFCTENKKIIDIAKNIRLINKEIDMYSYNWEVFLNYYLQKYEPDVLQGMQTDSFGEVYVAYYNERSLATMPRAYKLAAIIAYLVDNPVVLYDIIRKEDENIEWEKISRVNRD